MSGGDSHTSMMADRYRALARVGVGGTAVVYRCRDLHTQRIVAGKALRTNSSNATPEATKRFYREALLAAQLSHPAIVRVLDFGFTQPIMAGPQQQWSGDPDQPV